MGNPLFGRANSGSHSQYRKPFRGLQFGSLLDVNLAPYLLSFSMTGFHGILSIGSVIPKTFGVSVKSADSIVVDLVSLFSA